MRGRASATCLDALIAAALSGCGAGNAPPPEPPTSQPAIAADAVAAQPTAMGATKTREQIHEPPTGADSHAPRKEAVRLELGLYERNRELPDPVALRAGDAGGYPPLNIVVREEAQMARALDLSAVQCRSTIRCEYRKARSDGETTPIAFTIDSPLVAYFSVTGNGLAIVPFSKASSSHLVLTVTMSEADQIITRRITYFAAPSVSR